MENQAVMADSCATTKELTVELMMISCGRGWGHAVPDIAIASSVLTLLPSAQISFVSYADGVEAYKAHECAVTDLELP